MTESNDFQSEPDQDTSQSDDLQYLTLSKTSPSVEDLSDEDKAKILDNRASLGSETGCMMRFAPLRYGSLEPGDIEDLIETSYPVPRSALKSLPAHLQARLEETGYVQFFGRYDREAKEFYDVRLGRDEADAIDEILDLVSRFDLTIIPAFDYVVTESIGRYDPETIADIRDVELRTVEGNVDKVRSTLFDNPGPGSPTNKEITFAGKEFKFAGEFEDIQVDEGRSVVTENGGKLTNKWQLADYAVIGANPPEGAQAKAHLATQVLDEAEFLELLTENGLR